MSEEVDRLTVARFVAKHICGSAQAPPDEEELAEALSEIEIETQTLGSPFLKVYLIDPYYRLTNSGFVTVENERLDKIEIEFPEGSGWMWQLAAAEVTNNLTQPNLVLTFEDLIVAQLREIWGYKVVPPGIQTRAQFVKAMVDEANLKLRKEGKQPIRFVCPSLNQIQEVEENAGEKVETLTGKNELGQTTVTSKSKHNEQNKANRKPGISATAQLTVKGQPMTAEQREVAEELLAVADKEKGPVVTVEALFFAAIAESSITRNAGNGTYWGALSGSKANFPDAPKETQQLAESFFQGGRGFVSALQLAQKTNNPVQIAAEAEKPYGAGQNWKEAQYFQETGWENFLAEGQAIINSGGGVRGALLHGSGSTLGESDVRQLTRGTPAYPNEDTWDCVQRLAQQVRWSAWTAGMDIEDFVKGRFLYYMDAYDFIRQKPAAHIDIARNQVTNGHSGKTTQGAILEGLLGTFDNTAFEYETTHKVAGKLQRKSRIAKPSTPAEIRIEIFCRPLEYQAGDVFVVENGGPLNGRWVVTDAQRKYIADPYTTFTLAPPLLPYPEPAASGKGTPGGAVTGLQGVVEMAQKAYTEKAKYEYSAGSNRGNNGTLFGPAPRTMDCSAFATLCYKEAGLPDPSGQEYNPIGNTGSMIARMVKTSNPVPGDLVFYGPNKSYPAHVTVYIGNGMVIGMEDPSVGVAEGPVAEMGPSPMIGYYRLKGEYITELKSRG